MASEALDGKNLLHIKKYINLLLRQLRNTDFLLLQSSSFLSDYAAHLIRFRTAKSWTSPSSSQTNRFTQVYTTPQAIEACPKGRHPQLCCCHHPKA